MLIIMNVGGGPHRSIRGEAHLSGPHNCNKTKIKEFYKTCRIVVGYLALLDIIQIAKN